MRSVVVGGFSLGVALCLLLAPRAGSACEPAPNHSVRIVEDDTPACVVVESAHSYRAGELRIDNQCEEAFAFAVDDCSGCGDVVTVEPGQEATMVIERREQASNAALSWTVGEQSGRLLADIAWRDNSDACDDSALGCRTGSTGAGGWGAWACLVLLGVSFRRTARSEIR